MTKPSTSTSNKMLRCEKPKWSIVNRVTECLSAHTRFGSYIVAFALPIALFAIYWTVRPFADTLTSRTISLTQLTVPQRLNIQLASKYLNGVTLRPGERFSFNQTVGPRTERRGYVAAPSYVESQTALTTGGGICLLSSCLYQLALESGLTIAQRTPHLRTIKTVPPGLDATVWYGQSDFVFINSSSAPIQLRTSSNDAQLKIEMVGSASSTHFCSLREKQERIDKNHLRVLVVRSRSGQDETVSDDLYGLPDS